MNHFVNYRKRGVRLPKGCKNLSDVLKASGHSKNPGPFLDFQDAIRKGKCEYCGSPAVSGSVSWVSDSSGALDRDDSRFWCKQCQRDLADFFSDPENTLPEDIDFEDKAAVNKVSCQLEAMQRRQEAFMRSKVAERKGLT